MIDFKEFSLNDLRAVEEEIRPSTMQVVSVFSHEIEFLEEKEDVKSLRDGIESFLRDKFKYQERGFSTLKAGFLNFEEEQDEIICVYAKEAPTKIEFAFDARKIQQDRIKLINPQNSVKIHVTLHPKGTRITLFGGSEPMMKKVLDLVNIAIRSEVREGYRVYRSEISQEDMRYILSTLSSVEYIWIGPGESERFVKIVERKVGNDIKKIPEYLVHTKLHGIQIIGSPFVLEVIEEEGIRLKEIQGRISLFGEKVTSRISSSGKMLFWIPSHRIPRNSSLFEIAEIFYDQIRKRERKHYKQKPLGDYFVEN